MQPGSVTPLALLNLSATQKGEVSFHLDNSIKSEFVAIHPMENTSTIWIKQSDLLAILKKNGINSFSLDMTELPQEEKKVEKKEAPKKEAKVKVEKAENKKNG